MRPVSLPSCSRASLRSWARLCRGESIALRAAMLASPRLETVTSSDARARNTLIAVVTAIVAVVAASPPSAAAASEQAEPPARLEVVAPPSCATFEELEVRVTQRSARIRFTREPGAGLALRVAIVAQPTGTVIATLQIAGADGSRAERRLGAASCGEALDALALMIAVLLEPHALVPPPPLAIAAP